LCLSCSNNTGDVPIFLLASWANRMAEERNKRGGKVFYNRAQELCRSNSETIYAPCRRGHIGFDFLSYMSAGRRSVSDSFCLRRFSTVSGGNGEEI
jgi:hypothetical protein